MKLKLVFLMLMMMFWCACDDGDDDEPGYCEKSTACTQACTKMVSCGAFDSVDECQDAYASQIAAANVATSWCKYYRGASKVYYCETSDSYSEGSNCKAISDCDDFLSCM